MRIANADAVNVGLSLKVDNVPLADQPVPDETDANPVIGSQDADI